MKLGCDLKHHFFTDGGHGWLKVPVARLKKLGIENEITGFSYLKGSNAYLEEDCDLTTYVKALKKKDGLDPDDYTDTKSKVWLDTFWNNSITHDTSMTGRSVIRTYETYCVITDEQKVALEEIRSKVLVLKNWGRSAINQIKRAGYSELLYWNKYYKLGIYYPQSE